VATKYKDDREMDTHDGW